MGREALESKRFRISRSKIRYMECKYSVSRSSHSEGVDIQNQEIAKRSFVIQTIFSKDDEIVDDIIHNIQVGWLKWKAAFGVLCDRRVPNKLKENFYRVTIRQTMLYGTKFWVTKNQHVTKLSVAEMRILR